MIPNENRSVRASRGLPLMSSGAMYAGVPTITDMDCALRFRMELRPKSQILIVHHASSSRMFWRFKSR